MRESLRTIAEFVSLSQRLTARLTYAGLVILALGVAWWLIAGFLDLHVVFDALGGGLFGAFGVVGGLTLLPWVYGLAPLYALFTWGDWTPLAFTFAGTTVVTLIGPHLKTREAPRKR